MKLPWPTPTLSLLAAALWLAVPTSGHAQAGWTDPPSGLQALSGAASPPAVYCRAVAWSTYHGSQRAGSCTSSWAFWECRRWLDQGDAFDPINRSVEESHTSAIVRGDRRGAVFGPDVDHGHAVSWARARTDFGANSVEAHAWNGGTWTETRVEGAENGVVSSRTGFSNAGAFAYSEWTDVFTPNISGLTVLEFSLSQHPGSSRPSYAGFPLTLASGGDRGMLRVDVLNLDAPWPYESWSERVSRTSADGVSTSFMTLSLQLTAGNSYSLRSVLEANASNNGSVDFYGTARLERFVVSPGQSLSFASGTAYNVTVVPEPGTWALMLAGRAGVAWLAARRRV